MEDYKKRLEEALERAKKKIRGDKDHVLYEDDIIDIFPELAESEDERVRKALIEHIKGIYKGSCTEEAIKERDEFIAYLEKIPTDEEMKELLRTEYEKGRADALAEQKPADKIKQKFKEGDWIIYKEEYTGEEDVLMVSNPDPNGTSLYTGNGQQKYYLGWSSLNSARLWTIQDAKDGDVLADEYGIVLFKSIGNKDYNNVIDYYACTSSVSGGFVIQKGEHYWGDTQDCTLVPASKEQREGFFAVMREAGYEWDAEHKQLKKIEQKPNGWSEEDEEIRNFVTNIFKDSQRNGVSETIMPEQFDKIFNWLKSLKNRVGCEANFTTTKEWSKEDERVIYNIEQFLILAKEHKQARKELIEEAQNFLKALKERYTWKPTEEQLQALEGILGCVSNHSTWEISTEMLGALLNLKEQLKKLTE